MGHEGPKSEIWNQTETLAVSQEIRSLHTSSVSSHVGNEKNIFPLRKIMLLSVFLLRACQNRYGLQCVNEFTVVLVLDN